jgi:Domain of unknown function (DUF4288)
METTSRDQVRLSGRARAPPLHSTRRRAPDRAFCGMAASGEDAETTWFSALLRMVTFVDDAELEDLQLDEVVHVFRAPDRDGAFLRALELGREREIEFLNYEGSVVQVRFECIEELQRISAESIDGAEVSSRLSRIDFRPFDTVFEPWAHLPYGDFI